MLIFDTGHALLDVVVGQLTMLAYDKVEVFDVYKEINLLDIYAELSTIIVIDFEFELPLITSKDPLESSLMGYGIFEDADSNEMVQILDVASILIHSGGLKTLKRPLVPSLKPSINKDPKLELKELHPHLLFLRR